MDWLQKLTDRYKSANDEEAQRILDVMVMHEKVEWIEFGGSYQAFDPEDETGRHAISSDWREVYNDIFDEDNEESELEEWRKWAVSHCRSNTIIEKLEGASDSAKRAYLDSKIEILSGELNARIDELVAMTTLRPHIDPEKLSEYFVQMGENGKPCGFTIFKKEKADEYLKNGKPVAPIAIGRTIDGKI